MMVSRFVLEAFGAKRLCMPLSPSDKVGELDGNTQEKTLVVGRTILTVHRETVPL